MRDRRTSLVAGLICAVLFTVFGAAQDKPAATPSPSQTKPYVAIPPPPGTSPSIPAGTILRVRLGDTLSDKTNKTGDPFSGTLIKPVVVNGQEVVPAGSVVNGYVAFVKPSGRVKGVAQMRLLLTKLTTAEGDMEYKLAAPVEEAKAECASTSGTNEEGTIKGCGKSAKDAAKSAAITGAVGAGVGATVGSVAGRNPYCYWCGPNLGGMATGAGYGAAGGAGAALIYSLFKHEKHIILVQGMELVFTVASTTPGQVVPETEQAADSSNP